MPVPGLLGPNGKPISSATFAASNTRKRNPLIGELGNPWTGVHRPPTRFPLENSLQFDTSVLTMNDYRMMRDHYQINSSLTLLTFILHQLEFSIECDNPKIAKHAEDNLRDIWTRLVRALSQAFWAGFSPNALQWENIGNKTILTKVKDLPPEECRPHWKEVQGKLRGQPSPKVPIFDGIDQSSFGHRGSPAHIPVDNSLWYPLLMENGDMFGKKLLKSAFQPWFFSSLTHMFANRYYERFGEPVILARAPFDEEIEVDGNGTTMKGNILMGGLVNMVRNGAAVTMPNSQAQNGLDGVGNYEYTMEYLESQMRGADFERMLTRYDQEISLALFTPLLMMNTADGGSFNLGLVHTQMYYGMVRAIAADWKEYIDKYVLAPMATLNFGVNAKLPRIKFRPLGKTQEETVRAIISTILTSGVNGKKVELDLDELGKELGLTLKEGEIIQEPVAPAPENTGKEEDPSTSTGSKSGKPDPRTGSGRPNRQTATGKGVNKSKAIAARMADRITAQFTRAIKNDTLPNLDLGFSSQMYAEFSEQEVATFYTEANEWIVEYFSMVSASANPSESNYSQILRDGLVSQITEMAGEG